MRRHFARALQAVWLTGVVMVSVGTGPAGPPVHASTGAEASSAATVSGGARTSGGTRTGQGAKAQGGSKTPAAPSACVVSCEIFLSRKLGSGQVMTVLDPGGSGQDLYLGAVRNAGANGDFIVSPVGLVFQFCGADANNFFASSSYICANYPDGQVFELAWSPSGNESGLCAGVAQAGVSGESVTLQACGMNASTTWIFDPLHEVPGTPACTAFTFPPVRPGGTGSFCPLVSGGDTGPTDPLVLTVGPGPSSRLEVSHELLLRGVAVNDQQFAAYPGPSGHVGPAS